MEKASKHFINRDLLAPNVLEMDIDLDLLAPLSQVCHLLQQAKLAPGTINIHNGLQLHAKHPDWPSDIMWISHREPAGYSYFEELFNRMGIAEAVADRIKYDCRIVMYGGYFVTPSLQPKQSALRLDGMRQRRLHFHDPVERELQRTGYDLSHIAKRAWSL